MARDIAGLGAICAAAVTDGTAYRTRERARTPLACQCTIASVSSPLEFSGLLASHIKYSHPLSEEDMPKCAQLKSHGVEHNQDMKLGDR